MLADLPLAAGAARRHDACNRRAVMRQLLLMCLEIAEDVCVPFLGIVLWLLRPVLFALAVLASFAAGFRLALVTQ
jgi:hypothetical protein